MRDASPADVAAKVLDGSPRAAGRVISWAEDGDARGVEAIEALVPHTGDAEIVGITGPPGSGKSTLVDKLVDHYRGDGLTVGVIAVDPTSPFTGGAVLADRIRMGRRSTDPDVFVRSMGSRGKLGGLSPAVFDAVRVLDAMGKDIILIETTGVGQGEVDIVRTADSVVLVAVPGLGDDIQTIKAGIMEIADVFAVNKADLDGVDRTIAELESHLELAFEDVPEDAWRPPIVETVAKTGDGVDELTDACARHRKHLDATSELTERRRRRVEHELMTLLKQRLVERVAEHDQETGAFQDAVDAIVEGAQTPHAAAEDLIDA